MSWNGTVRCGNCYESGHNRTGCPELKKAWEADPTSYNGREWARILSRKAKPKVCGYCDKSGHTRAGCETLKGHKVAFTIDATLWRSAIVKWMKDIQLGIGALVRCQDASYHEEKNGYLAPDSPNYIPPVGMVMEGVNSVMTHYHGIMNSSEWCNSGSILSFQRIGASIEEAPYRSTIGITLPCIPGIVPRYGKGWYGDDKIDRVDRLSNVDWEVVSAGQTDFGNDTFVCPKNIKRTVKEHFKAPNEQTEGSFLTFGDFQREQLRDYVNDALELSEMKDPELPETNS